MPYHVINFADVESFEPMPGSEWYGVEIDKVEVRENKDGDALYLNWELVVVDGDYENRRLWMITSLKDTALRRLKTVFEELGVMDDEEELEIEYDDDIEPTTKSGPRLLYPEVEGLEASVFVKNEMYEGTERNKVIELRSEAPKSKKRKRSRHDEEDEPRARSRRPRDEDEDEPRSRRSTRHRNEDEDDKPRSQSRTVSRSRRDEDDEDYDDRSTRRSKRDEEDEEDERPRRRTATRSRSGSRRRIR